MEGEPIEIDGESYCNTCGREYNIGKGVDTSSSGARREAEDKDMVDAPDKSWQERVTG